MPLNQTALGQMKTKINRKYGIANVLSFPIIRSLATPLFMHLKYTLKNAIGFPGQILNYTIEMRIPFEIRESYLGFCDNSPLCREVQDLENIIYYKVNLTAEVGFHVCTFSKSTFILAVSKPTASYCSDINGDVLVYASR